MSLKTRPIATILASAYLSAMLTSSLAPIRNNTIFAAAVDPMAAEKALQNAVSGLDVAGWAAAAQTSAPSQSSPNPVPVKVTPKADPVLNDELLARLIKFTRDLEGVGWVDARICKVMDLCDGSKDMPVKLSKGDSTDGDHFFALPSDPKSKDIVMAVKRGAYVETYLTDKTRTLRAASVLENGVARLITNEKAAEKFKAELTMWASEALTLPPTGAAVPGNS
jgi:hypothetical protein